MTTIWVDLLGSQVHFVGKKYRTRVIEAGAGEPLIMIHGIGGHAEAYSGTSSPVATLPAPGHRHGLARVVEQAAVRRHDARVL